MNIYIKTHFDKMIENKWCKLKCASDVKTFVLFPMIETDLFKLDRLMENERRNLVIHMGKQLRC